MKRSKDRLNSVIVIGANPAGIAAANKLGELGIPVILVDSDFDLDKKLSVTQWKLNSGIPFNHAHRPGILRLLRNSDVQCFIPAEIISIKHSSQGFKIQINKFQTFIDENRCTLCGRCLEVCPVSEEKNKKAIILNSRRSIPGRVYIDKRREPLCQLNCPLGVNVQGYMALVKTYKFKEALELIRQDNILPGICGRICTHPCEANCRRGEVDQPISIKDIKRFVADTEKNSEISFNKTYKIRAEKIAIIGSGPSGLSCAADLARFGFEVTIFEKEESAGGLLRYAIGEHRLPRDIVDLEINYIKNLGVKIVTSHPVDLSQDLEQLKKDFNAVVIAVGTWLDQRLGVLGEDLENVYGCISFLTRLYKNENFELSNKTAAVIGDGNSAFDLARTLVRKGAKVSIISWFSKDKIPADAEEVSMAEIEGIKIVDSTKIIEFVGENGKLKYLECMPTKPGEMDEKGIAWPKIISDAKPFKLVFDTAFVAIGQKRIFLNTDSGVYTAGDIASGPSSVVDAMAQGRAVAKSILQDICKDDFDYIQSLKNIRPKDKDFEDIPKDMPLIARKEGCILDQADAVFESSRCLQCGICSQCLKCVEVCGDIKAINHAENQEEITEHAGLIIIADPDKAPDIKGEDVIRAYNQKGADSDVYAMMLRGYSAAANAMILLRKNSNRPKGHGISFNPPDPGLSKEIRIGVFVCRCNDSFGWTKDLSQYLEDLKSESDIVHVETLNSACLNESMSLMLRTIREKGITRIVIGSCVCCPLNFVCSACTDQRNRLKKFLFSGTGISRAMVETCNIRGEALRLLKQSKDEAKVRFCGLLNRSVNRTRKLKPLTVAARNYNFATAIIGESDAVFSSAKILAEAGVEVLLFGAFKELYNDKKFKHKNIHNFENSQVIEISGTLGDFQLFIESDGQRHIIQAGTVILGEESRENIKYLHQEGLLSQYIESSMQKEGIEGIPFFYPGTTSIPGLYLASPPGINISERKKGAAAAVHAAAVMPRGPRQSRGYTVMIDDRLCRGCGRCYKICSYQAITFRKNFANGWSAYVDEALCKGCGNCISVCPSNAADSPYRDQLYLENALYELLAF